MKAVDIDDKTPECKVKLEVIADAQRRTHENLEMESLMEVG